MAFEYETNVDAVVSNLLPPNTTTASPDTSANLTRRIATIKVGDPETASVNLKELPAVFVRIQSADEEAAGLGGTGPTGVQKFKEVVYEIVSMYHRDGAHTGLPDHMDEAYTMARNVEGVFQAEYRLSNTAMWCHPERTDFGGFQFGAVRIRASVIQLRAKYMFR